MGKNKVARPRAVPREFVVVVGGPSNTFNGYTEFDPASQTDKPRPKPTNLEELSKKYLPPNPNPNFVGTHDLYWGNFIDPVHRLFSQGIAQPLPGDMVTVAVYFPPYQERNEDDWAASPHNPVWHKSPWVNGTTPYDRTIRDAEQGANKGKDKPTHRKANPGFQKEKLSDARIDHEILMRTTDERTGPQIKRPRRPSHYADLIHDVPRRCVHGTFDFASDTVVMPGVLVKLILIRDLAELLGYLATGNWSGEQAIHILDVGGTEEDMHKVGINDDTTWDFYARGKVPAQALKFWKKIPVVDRKHVKIQRLDYFGHSAPDAWFLQYGTKNDKGEIPEGEVLVTAETLIDQTFAFGPKPHLAKDAVFHLWGCSLGEPGGMAEKLTEKLVPVVIACDDLTTYEGIADTDASMPQPVSPGKFRLFKRAP